MERRERSKMAGCVEMPEGSGVGAVECGERGKCWLMHLSRCFRPSANPPLEVPSAPSFPHPSIQVCRRA